MKRHLLVFCGSLLAGMGVVYGCGDDTVDLQPKPDSGAPAIFIVTSDAAGRETGPTGAGAPPALGDEIDRMGRPAINTALDHTFDPDAGTHGAAEDDYNQNRDPTTWNKDYAAEIAKNLAIYDGLDQTCGNQAFADGDAGTNAERYGALAGVLADDRLWLDTSQTTCAQYLAVELAALTASKSTDCGGRMPGYDVIDTTFTALGATLGPDAGTVTDGVAKTAAKTDGTAFPYLIAPASH